MIWDQSGAFVKKMCGLIKALEGGDLGSSFMAFKSLIFVSQTGKEELIAMQLPTLEGFKE